MYGTCLVPFFICLFIGKIQCDIENSNVGTPYDVIVVGLGASGVAALSALGRVGLKVLGLEAADRIGGRVKTVEFGGGVVELGAEWIHGENPSMTYNLATQNHVPIRKETRNFHLIRSDGSQLSQETVDNLMNFCLEVIDGPQEGSESLGKHYTRKFLEYIPTIPSLANDTEFVNGFLEFSNNQVGLFDGSNDWDDVSTASSYESPEGSKEWSWHALGYRTLFDIALDKYNNGTGLPVDIKLNKEVSSIQWSEDTEKNVIVKCKDNATYSAKSVIFTASLGVLKEKHDTLFEPNLPDDKISAIQSLTIGVVDKVVFSYDTVWWPSDVKYCGFIWNSADKVNVSQDDAWTTKINGYSVPLGCENCVTLWFAGETAKLVETLPDDVVIRKCTEVLRKFIGDHVPEPTAVVRSAWYSNPLTRGSYTFDSSNMTDSFLSRAALAAPILDEANAPKLLFAGEATRMTNFGTVHGAFESGAIAAENVLRNFNISRNRNSRDTPYDVIVVGLGASGVAALSALARADRRVLGLEAADRIGGRVKTVEFGTGVVEVGAEWIHGEHPSPTFELAVENKVPIRKQEFKTSLHRSDGSEIEDEIVEDLMNFTAEMMSVTPEQPELFGVFFTRRFEEHISSTPSLSNDTDFKEGFLEFANRMYNILEASNDWNDVSSVQAYEELEGDQQWSWHVLGYKTLFDLLLNKYGNGTGLPADIKLNKEVTSVQWSENPDQLVTVKCKDDSTYNAKSVIVTLSVGVLKERHNELFNPKLPEEKINAINTVQMGVVDKIIFSYDTKWWDPENSFFGFIWKNEDRTKVPEEDEWTTRIYGFTTPLGSENVLTLWTTSDTAKLVESLPEDVVRTKCTALLRKFLGPKVPEPTAMIRSTWYSNPFTRGSYTHDGANVTDPTRARVTLATPLFDTANGPKLLFAGEATNPNHFSTVHGAVETGAREARVILNHLENTATD